MKVLIVALFAVLIFYVGAFFVLGKLSEWRGGSADVRRAFEGPPKGAVPSVQGPSGAPPGGERY